MTEKTSVLTFIRYNIVSIIATTVDFLVLITLTEFFKLWYLTSGIIGAFSGGVTSFVLGRNWAFNKKDGSVCRQAIRYTIIWLGSIFLNTYGLYFFVDILNIQYIIAKIIVAIFIGLGFNYIMQKYFIFR